MRDRARTQDRFPRTRSLAPAVLGPCALAFWLLAAPGAGIAAAGSSLSNALDEAAIRAGYTGTDPRQGGSDETEPPGRIRGDHAETNPDKLPPRGNTPPETLPPRDCTPDPYYEVVPVPVQVIHHGSFPDPDYGYGRTHVDIEVTSHRRGRGRGSSRADHPTFYATASLDGLEHSEEMFDRGGQLSVRLGGFAPESGDRFGLEGGLAIAHFEAAPRLADGIEDIYEFTLEGAFRLYGASSRAPLGFYGTAGIRGGLLRWEYTNPLWSGDPHGFHDVRSDHVGTWSPYLGAGMTFFRNQPLQFDVALIRGLQFYGEETDAGFFNDVFDTGAFTQLRLGVLGVF